MKRYSFLSVAALMAGALLLPSCDNEDSTTPPPADDNFRPATGTSSARCDRVYEWTPAPGQFINEPATGTLDTPEAAAAWAETQLSKGLAVSLGGFGGYIVAGFDHSVEASADGGYDFAIGGNAFFNAGTGKGGSNEPGIVYVMQDTNGNGLPDDTWFELAGSDTAASTTIRDYAVTYTRPSAPAMPVEWTDNRGGSGTIDYLATFHKQDYYYPAWVKADTYTLRGTCLAAQNTLDESTGFWNNSAYGFGYADNMGSDSTAALEGFPQANRFRIADAIDSAGNPVGLRYIDFVKVQTGVNAKSGWLGEVSTEITGIIDL